jgi:hypothetical protein
MSQTWGVRDTGAGIGMQFTDVTLQQHELLAAGVLVKAAPQEQTAKGHIRSHQNRGE